MTLGSAYRLNYKDCSNPKRVNEVSVKEQCQTRVEQKTKGKTRYTILQKRKHLQMKGYKCKVVKSTFTIYCGAFSHSKLMTIPKIELTQPTTPHQCESMITTSRYMSLEGTTHEVLLDQETVFSVSELGVIHVDDNSITCAGEVLKINDHVVNNVLQMAQYRITLAKEEYIVDQKRVEALTDHVRLPQSCTLEARGCTTNDVTFIWQPPTVSCPFQKIRVGTFQRETGGWLVDHDHKLVFKIDDTSKSPPSCTPADIHYTEYPAIFLSKATDWDQVQEVDIALFAKTSDDYVLYTSERLYTAERSYYQGSICQEKYLRTDTNIITLNDGNMAKRNGDVLYVFKCEDKIGKILASDVCFDKIPLDDGITFVDPITRIATQFKTIRDCNTHFPQIIETLDGWVSINPELKQVKPPQGNPAIEHTETPHEDLSQGGLYTKEEMESWETLIQYQDFHDAITSHISYGVCVNAEHCTPIENTQQFIPSYDLQHLVAKVADEANFWTQWRKVLNEYGAYISLIVITKWTLELAIITSLTVITYTKEGLKASMAFLYTIFCGSVKQAKKVHARSQRIRNRAPDDDEAQPMTVVKRV